MKQRHRKKFLDRLKEKIEAHLLNHAHSLFSSLGRLSRTPFTSAMTVLVLAVSISLAGGFYVMVINIQQITGNIQSSNQMSLFLRDNVNESAGQKLAEQIRQNPNVVAVKYISKKQAMEEFKANSGFADALNALDTNPLPSVIQVLPKNVLEGSDEINQLLAEFKKNPQVELVQIDMQWVNRLQSIMQIIGRAIMLVSILLGFAVTFITGNTIRLELHNRQNEVYISKLVGATQSFIQRPFIYTGFWLGLMGGFLGWLIITITLFMLQQPIEQLSALYNDSFQLLFLSFLDFLIILFSSAALSMLGAWAVLNYQLGNMKPQ